MVWTRRSVPFGKDVASNRLQVLAERPPPQLTSRTLVARAGTKDAISSLR